MNDAIATLSETDLSPPPDAQGVAARRRERRFWARIAAAEVLILSPSLIGLALLSDGMADRLVKIASVAQVFLGFPAALAGAYLVIGHVENKIAMRMSASNEVRP